MGKGQTAGIPNWFKKKIDEFKTIAIPLLKSDWVLDEATQTYRQEVTVKGVTDKSSPTVGLSSVEEIATRDEMEAFLCITDIVTSADKITFIANKLPNISFTVVAKGIVASGNEVAADITALVGKVNELEQGLEVLQSYSLSEGVDIVSYITSDNTYTCPSDGYVTAQCTYEKNKGVNIHILSKDGARIPLVCTSTPTSTNTISNNIISTFVKKGMRVYFEGSGLKDAKFYGL